MLSVLKFDYKGIPKIPLLHQINTNNSTDFGLEKVQSFNFEWKVKIYNLFCKNSPSKLIPTLKMEFIRVN